MHKGFYSLIVYIMNIFKCNSKQRIGLIIVIYFSVQSGYAQRQMRISKVDSAGLIAYISANYAYNFILKSSDLFQESGNLMGAGVNFSLKPKSNWTIETGFNYYFSGKVKGVDSLFSMLSNNAGLYMDGNGTAADIEVDTRAWSLRLEGGKIIPVSKRSLNTGIHVKCGIGVLQRYIFIKNPDNLIPGLTKEYKKGYDRLTLGFTLYQYIGYTRLSNTKFACFYGGFEFYEVFSKRQREYDFNLMGKDNRKFFDTMIGLKFGWIIPLYKKEYIDTYYFR